MSKGFSVLAKVTGAKKLQDKLNKFEKEILSNQVAAMQEATILVHSNAVKLLQDNSSGTPVRRYNPKRIAIASKPGDAPNTDTGRLVQSIKMQFQKNGLVGLVGTNVKYGAALEFGTSKMRRRPWLSVALKEASKEVAQIFANAFKKGVKEVKK